MHVRRYPWWFLPVFSLALGCATVGAFWAGGNPTGGLAGFGVMVALALVFALGGRSETIRGLRGDGRDEYWARIDAGASMIAGLVLICAVIAMCLWEWAHGRDGSPYAELGAVAGVSYVVALIAARLRG
jgi:hypothetical protein